MSDFLLDPRFKGIERFEKKVWLSSPTMHGDEQKWVDNAIETNWVSTVGANINEIERQIAEYIGVDALNKKLINLLAAVYGHIIRCVYMPAWYPAVHQYFSRNAELGANVREFIFIIIHTSEINFRKR